MTLLTHIDQETNRAAMVDVSEKTPTLRTAHARVRVKFPAGIMGAEKQEIHSKKGPVFHTAIIAGTQAVKQTSFLIPLCHTLMIEDCKIDIRREEEDQVVVDCKVRTFGKTGVEMEAMTGAAVAALTIYDMCKALSHQIQICDLHLVEKTGGKGMKI